MDMEFFDEQMRHKLDAAFAERFKKTGVCEYVPGEGSAQFSHGEIVKARWVRAITGSDEHTEVRCRLVAQEVVYGQRVDELCAGLCVGTPMLLLAVGRQDFTIMLLSVKCSFLYGEMCRNVYIELLRQDSPCGDGRLMGKFMKAMYGTRDAPLIWREVGEGGGQCRLAC